MITKVARNDVVRLTRTGEVGLVKGWADHEKLAEHGTIIDVEIGRGQTIQANGDALEFVANAKRKINPWAAWAIVLVSLGISGFLTYSLVDEGVNAYVAGALGGFIYPGVDRMLVRMFVDKKSRITLPRVKRQAVSK